MVLGDELTRTLSVESGGHSSGSEQAPDPKTARTGEASPIKLSNSDIRCTFCNKPKKHYPKLKYRTCRVSAYSDTVDKNFADGIHIADHPGERPTPHWSCERCAKRNVKAARNAAVRMETEREARKKAALAREARHTWTTVPDRVESMAHPVNWAVLLLGEPDVPHVVHPELEVRQQDTPQPICEVTVLWRHIAAFVGRDHVRGFFDNAPRVIASSGLQDSRRPVTGDPFWFGLVARGLSKAGRALTQDAIRERVVLVTLARHTDIVVTAGRYKQQSETHGRLRLRSAKHVTEKREATKEAKLLKKAVEELRATSTSATARLHFAERELVRICIRSIDFVQPETNIVTLCLSVCLSVCLVCVCDSTSWSGDMACAWARLTSAAARIGP